MDQISPSRHTAGPIGAHRNWPSINLDSNLAGGPVILLLVRCLPWSMSVRFKLTATALPSQHARQAGDVALCQSQPLYRPRSHVAMNNARAAALRRLGKGHCPVGCSLPKAVSFSTRGYNCAYRA
jgi:hypothetical protein